MRVALCLLASTAAAYVGLFMAVLRPEAPELGVVIFTFAGLVLIPTFALMPADTLG